MYSICMSGCAPIVQLDPGQSSAPIRWNFHGDSIMHLRLQYLEALLGSIVICYILNLNVIKHIRPQHEEYTGSRPLSPS